MRRRRHRAALVAGHDCSGIGFRNLLQWSESEFDFDDCGFDVDSIHTAVRPGFCAGYAAISVVAITAGAVGIDVELSIRRTIEEAILDYHRCRNVWRFELYF